MYILNRLAANRAASSPPAPPLISTNTFLSSFGSFGNNNICILFSNSISCSFNIEISSDNISLISLSDSSSNISLLASKSSTTFLYSLYAVTIISKSACSLQSFLHSFWLAIIEGSDIFTESSSYLFSVNANLSNNIVSLHTVFFHIEILYHI